VAKRKVIALFVAGGILLAIGISCLPNLSTFI
jgi:hypothetical protein